MKEHWSSLDNLVLVAGHAVYVADNLESAEEDRGWYLERFQRGEPPFYIEHIRAGVDIAADDPNSLLVFSGGQTRRNAGPRTEAQSYWLIANHYRWWSREDTAFRATTEEFARDSFENVLFGSCRFFECVGRYPEKVTVVSWEFKQQRFDLHREAIKYPSANFAFAGVNNPVDLDGALKGEEVARRQFNEDPFGTELASPGEKPKLGDKRQSRDPFNRRHPYFVSCPDLTALLRHKTSDGREFNGGLPWLGGS